MSRTRSVAMARGYSNTASVLSFSESPCGPVRVEERRDLVGFPEQTHDGVDHVAAQLVHDASLVLPPLRRALHGELVVHRRANHVHITQRALAHSLHHRIERRVVTVLIPDLQNEMFCWASSTTALKSSSVRDGGFSRCTCLPAVSAIRACCA